VNFRDVMIVNGWYPLATGEAGKHFGKVAIQMSA
jgi:hypothetical protein